MLVLGPACGAQDDRAAAAVVYKGKVIYLNEKGTFLVWDLKRGEVDREMSSKLSRESVAHLASDGDNLWAAGKSRLFSWSSEERSWKKLADFKGSGLAALVGLGGSPLLVFPSKVMDPVGGRTFEVPMLKGQVRTNSLRILAVHTTDSMLWFGTGYGEWGGHLVGLNRRTGEWLQYYDPLHYVTGITEAAPGEVTVSWSMSHFGANTLIRIHKLDGTPKTTYPELDSKYYQKICYSPFDKTLYGVENTDVVSIREGKPSKIAKLDGKVFEREPKAIGVSPGIAVLLPVDQKTLIIVPNHGAPWKMMNGELTRLPVR
jgi:hypothetical protein